MARLAMMLRPVLLTMGFLAIGVLLAVTPAVSPALAQEGPTIETTIAALSKLETPSDIEVPALRQQVADRIKAKADAAALKRPPVSRELNKLPHVELDIQFNPDTPVIRPESYAVIARMADALTNPALMSFTFLVVGHVESNGRRDNNLALSQRRAEAIRDALVQTFKLSSKRIFAVGLGEEQLLDANNPKAAVNQQAQIVTLGEVVPVVASAKPPDAGRPAKSAKSHAGKASK
jgi:outer membrane protein OmpA-like peptidoglycan-associated protein